MSAWGCSVVVVTFGEILGAQQWLRDTKCAFPYYTNPDATLYKMLGLKRRTEPVWNCLSLSYYASALVAGVTLPKATEFGKDDPHQMGGDFIVNKSGKLLMAYHSKIPSDRPSVEMIKDALKH